MRYLSCIGFSASVYIRQEYLIVIFQLVGCCKILLLHGRISIDKVYAVFAGRKKELQGALVEFEFLTDLFRFLAGTVLFYIETSRTFNLIRFMLGYINLKNFTHIIRFLYKLSTVLLTDDVHSI